MPEIVHRDMHAERLDTPQCRERAVEIAHQRGLGDLEFEPAGCEAGFQQHFMHELHEILVVDLHRRNVDGDGQRLRPGRGLLAGLAQNPLADAENGAGFLRDRNEHGRRNRTAGLVIPAQQGFEADHGPSLNVFLWLIDQIELAAGHRLPQIVLQHAAVMDFRAHSRFEETVGGAAFHLGAVERGIGVHEQRLAIVRIVRADRDADAARGHVVAVGIVTAGSQRLEDAVGQPSRHGRAGQSGDKDREFVAAEARDHACLVEDRGDA